MALDPEVNFPFTFSIDISENPYINSFKTDQTATQVLAKNSENKKNV